MSVTSVSAENGQLSDGLSLGQFCFWEQLPSTYLGMPTERLFKCGGIVAMTILAIALTTVTVVALLAQKHQYADLVFRAERNWNNRDIAEHDRLVCCDVVRPGLFVVVLNLREIVGVAG